MLKLRLVRFLQTFELLGYLVKLNLVSLRDLPNALLELALLIVINFLQLVLEVLDDGEVAVDLSFPVIEESVALLGAFGCRLLELLELLRQGSNGLLSSLDLLRVRSASNGESFFESLDSLGVARGIGRRLFSSDRSSLIESVTETSPTCPISYLFGLLGSLFQKLLVLRFECLNLLLRLLNLALLFRLSVRSLCF